MTEQRRLQCSQAPARRELPPRLGGQGGRFAGKPTVPPRRARTVGAPVVEAAGPSTAIPYSQALRSLTQGWPHGCSAPLQALKAEAVRGFGGLPAPWGSAAWLETPSDAACRTSSPGWLESRQHRRQELHFFGRVQSQPTWDCEQLIFPICTTISF